MSDAAAIRAALAEGRCNDAVDAAREALAADALDGPARYLLALAFARVGARDSAAAALEPLTGRGDIAPSLKAESFALEARLLKDQLARSTDASQRERWAREACARYEQAHAHQPSAFAAVNAATLHCLLGDGDSAARMAHVALGLVRHTRTDHWDAATAGEASLLLHDHKAALDHYRGAASIAGRRHGDLASMRRQLRLLATVLPDAQSVLDAIPGPVVISFTGHMPDRPGRTPPRFPGALEPRVREAIHSRIAALGAAIGYSQAAAGGDILFVEAMQRAGNETHVVLPCATEDFIEQSVRFAGAHWEDRFKAALAGATSVTHATAEAFLGDDVLFDHAARLIHGMAILRARQVDGRPLLLAALDPGAAGGLGGAAETLEAWQRTQHSCDVIDIAGLRGDGRPGGPVARPASSPPAHRPGRTVCAMVFADVRGYSKLPENHSPRFTERFLRIAKQALDPLSGELRSVATAGDGVFAVFASVRAATRFALDLRDAVGGVDWSEYSMPADTHVRVAVHCGPAYGLTDPVTLRANFCGTHVNMTARIEPIVTPGAVFATEAVAAYLALDRQPQFDCEYLGVLPLAKGFGERALYRVEASA